RSKRDWSSDVCSSDLTRATTTSISDPRVRCTGGRVHFTRGSEIEVVVARVVTRVSLRGHRSSRLALGLVAVALATSDLSGGETQRRTGLLHVQLQGDALVAILVGELVLLELAGDEHAVTLADRLSEVLAVLPPQRAAQEGRITVDPLLTVTVEEPVIVSDRERGHGNLLLGVAQLRIS